MPKGPFRFTPDFVSTASRGPRMADIDVVDPCELLPYEILERRESSRADRAILMRAFTSLPKESRQLLAVKYSLPEYTEPDLEKIFPEIRGRVPAALEKALDILEKKFTALQQEAESRIIPYPSLEA